MITAKPVWSQASQRTERATEIAIEGQSFLLNGKLTYSGRQWQGHRIEGLLMNSRMVQGIFDDQNLKTRHLWDYPDGPWDADRNTLEFVEAMSTWRDHGLLCVVVNLQGGSPTGYGNKGWINSAYQSDGSLRADYLSRLDRILSRADELGMVVMLGLYYFGQDQVLADEQAVKRGVTNAIDWVVQQDYRNVLIEIANEHDGNAYDHDIIRNRPEELIVLAQQHAKQLGRVIPVSVSLTGGKIPSQAVVDVSDFVLLHGNGVKDPMRMVKMIEQVRSMMGGQLKPVMNNEDDRPWTTRSLNANEQPQGWSPTGTTNNFVACVRNYASWGFFDWRENDEPYEEGFQSVPVNWQISSDRKRAFFDLLAEITGATATN